MEQHKYQQDWDLVQACLRGEQEGWRVLYESVRPVLIGELVRSGASGHDAAESVDEIIAQCIGSPADSGKNDDARLHERPEISSQIKGEPRLRRTTRISVDMETSLLSRYRGEAPLRTWLRVIALNHFRSFKRRQATLEKITRKDSVRDVLGYDESSQPEPVKARNDGNLIESINAALRHGIARCDPEAIVMIYLIYYEGLRQKDLTRIWQRHPANISRRINASLELIRSSVVEYLQEKEPWLTVTWEDILELCEGSIDLLG